MDKTFEQQLDNWVAEMNSLGRRTVNSVMGNIRKDNSLGQTSNKLRKEIAAIKKMLDDTVVSIQTANDKITKIS